MCFCGHRLREHFPNLSDANDWSCKMAGSDCVEFSYVPVYGSADIVCANCKMSFRKHSSQHPHPLIGDEKTCGKFESKWSCICKYGYEKHTTMFETRDERIKAGKVVGNNSTGFSLNNYANECESNYEDT